MLKKLLLILILCTSVFAQQKAHKYIRSFNAGELSPLVKAREDLSKFHAGLATMENMIPTPQGPAQKRPGTKYVAESKNNTNIRLIPFEYSTEQAYIIELGNQYARFYKDNATLYKKLSTEDLSAHSANIVAHWKCNDNDAQTTVDDETGNHNGTAWDRIGSTATATSNLASNDGTNYYFDLNSDQYSFSVSDHADFTFGDGATDSRFTLITNIYYISDGAEQRILTKNTAANQEWELIATSADKVEFKLTDDSVSQHATVTTDDALSSNTWYCIIATYDGTGGSSASDGMKIYVDFSEWDTTKSTDAGYIAMEDKAAAVTIGADSTLNMEGYVDNVAILDDELIDVEVYNLEGNSTTFSYEIVTPYLTADLFDLKFKQSADVLYIVHPDYEPRKLSRYGDVSWIIEESAFENGPFLDENANNSWLITPSAISGSITLTASGADFRPFIDGTTAGHEPSGSTATSKSQTGALFKIVQSLDVGAYEETLSDNYTNDQTEDVSWLDCGTIAKGVTWYLTTLGTWTGTLEVQRNYTIGAAHGDSGWEAVFTYQANDDRNVTTNSTESVDEADYRVILTATGDAAEDCDVYFRISDTDHVGIVEITAVTDSQTATATVIETLANTDATHRWAEGSWSNYRGWPRTVTFFEDRLVFGGNANQPDTIWASETANYDNFLGGVDDDEPLAFTLSSRQVNVIEWIIGKDKILIGTSGAEWTIDGGADEPLTPSNVIAEQHSNLGSANLQGILAGESVLFFQRGAEKMRELAYNWELDSYVAPDMTILADHITGDGITNIAYQRTPNPIMWCVRDDGEMAIFVYERKELITSWSRIITDGLFESVAVINGDPEDEVWVSVKRTIDGGDVRYIEYFETRDYGSDGDDAYYVDCGITYDSTATTTITGLDHVEGETVLVLGDGAVQTSQTVSSGQITITQASTVQVGLAYDAVMKTMPLSMATEGASILGRTKRINQAIPQYYNSGDFYIGRDSTDKELLSISGIDTSDVDTDDRVTFPPGSDRFGYIYIYQQSPEPLTLLGMLVEFGVK